MSKSTLTRFILGCIILLTSSCQQRMYFPDRANTPGLIEALEARLTLSLKPQSNDSVAGHQDNGNTSFAADIAFAPINHLGIIGSYRSLHNRGIGEDHFYNNNSNFGGLFNGHRWEGGLGFFDKIGKVGKYELYGGYGQGRIERIGFDNPQLNFTTNYHRFFLQGAAGAGNKMFSATGGIRFAMHKYFDFESANRNLRYEIMRNSSSDVEGQVMGFIEPFVNGEIGYKYVKFNLQLGFSYQYFGGNISGNLPVYASFGLAFSFAPRYLLPDPPKRERRSRGRHSRRRYND